MKEVDEYNIFHEDSVVEYAGLKLAEVSYKPIKVFSELHVDTMSAVTTAMSRMNEGEGVAVQILITPASKNGERQGDHLSNLYEIQAVPKRKEVKT